MTKRARTSTVIDFPGNRRSPAMPDQPATIIILPVVRIERAPVTTVISIKPPQSGQQGEAASMGGRVWSYEESLIVRAGFRANLTAAQIAAQLDGRTAEGVANHARNIGCYRKLPRRQVPQATPQMSDRDRSREVSQLGDRAFQLAMLAAARSGREHPPALGVIKSKLEGGVTPRFLRPLEISACGSSAQMCAELGTASF